MENRSLDDEAKAAQDNVDLSNEISHKLFLLRLNFYHSTLSQGPQVFTLKDCMLETTFKKFQRRAYIESLRLDCGDDENKRVARRLRAMANNIHPDADRFPKLSREGGFEEHLYWSHHAETPFQKFEAIAGMYKTIEESDIQPGGLPYVWATPEVLAACDEALKEFGITDEGGRVDEET